MEYCVYLVQYPMICLLLNLTPCLRLGLLAMIFIVGNTILPKLPAVKRGKKVGHIFFTI